MSKIVIFNPETGKKVAEGSGTVTRTDESGGTHQQWKAVTVKLYFELQAPDSRWRLLRRHVMGRKSRMPRKIKKAVNRPCARSKWVARSACFTARLWRRYCETPMQPGQCRTLQARLLIYLAVNGCEYSWRNNTLKCEMPSGVKLAVFPIPNHFQFGDQQWDFYGIVIYPYRKYRRRIYIAEDQAMYLYKRLGEHIRDKVEQLNQGRKTE